MARNGDSPGSVDSPPAHPRPTIGCYLCGKELDKKRPYDHYKDWNGSENSVSMLQYTVR